MQIVDIDFCSIDDLEELCTVENACFDLPWSAALIEKDLENQGSIVYCKAACDGDIVGYGAISRRDRAAHVMNIAVLPERRRQGVASQLMIAFQEIAAVWGCGKMTLEVRTSNHDARSFYSKLGFVYVARARGYYSDGEDALLLSADLPLAIS